MIRALSVALLLIFSKPIIADIKVIESYDEKATLIFLAGGRHCRTYPPSWGFGKLENITTIIPPCDEVDDIDLDEIKTPIFVAGISTGSIKSVQYFSRHPDKISGVVLLSAITSRKCKWCGSLYDTDYRSLDVPVLFVNHEGDRCPSTMDMGITRRFKDNLPSNDTTIEMVSGGYDQGGESLEEKCFKDTHHSFTDVKHDVMSIVESWILNRVE